MLSIVLNRIFLLFILFSLLLINKNSFAFTEKLKSNPEQKKIEKNNKQDNNDESADSKAFKGSKLKNYFLNNKLVLKKNNKEHTYQFASKNYSVSIDGNETEIGKWKVTGLLQNYIELSPKNKKKYYFQKLSNGGNVLEYDEILKANNFLKKLKDKEVGKKNTPDKSYNVVSSKNQEPVVKKITQNNNSKKNNSNGIVIGNSNKNSFDLEFKKCQSYGQNNLPFKTMNIKINTEGGEFNSISLMTNLNGSEKSLKKTAKKMNDNFYRIAVAPDLNGYYWYKFNFENGRFVTEYYTKPSGDIFAMGQLSYQIFGYCEEVLNNGQAMKVDIASIKNNFPQKKINISANTSLVNNTVYNGSSINSYNNATRNRCFASGNQIADPLANKIVSKLFKTKENKTHIADPTCANMANALSADARQKMRNAGIATVTQYYFYESLIFYNEGLELLLRAFDKNVEADKLKAEREYLQRGGIGTDGNKKFGKFVTSNVAIDVSSLISSTIEIKAESAGYYEKALPKVGNAAYSMTNYIIVVAHSLDKMDKSADGINNIMNVIGAASTVPKLPEYLKTLYSTTKLVFNGAKDRKIKDKGNSQKALKDLGFL